MSVIGRQSFKKGNQLHLGHKRDMQRFNIWVPPKTGCAAVAIMVQHINQIAQASIVHIRCPQRDIAQTGGLKSPPPCGLCVVHSARPGSSVSSPMS